MKCKAIAIRQQRKLEQKKKKRKKKKRKEIKERGGKIAEVQLQNK